MLDWRMRKARKAFENELIRQGMTKEYARRLSAGYLELRESVMEALRRFALKRHP